MTVMKHDDQKEHIKGEFIWLTDLEGSIMTGRCASRWWVTSQPHTGSRDKESVYEPEEG